MPISALALLLIIETLLLIIGCRKKKQGRYRMPISTATAGMWVMVGGIDDSMIKTVTGGNVFWVANGYQRLPADAPFSVAVSSANPEP